MSYSGGHQWWSWHSAGNTGSCTRTIWLRRTPLARSYWVLGFLLFPLWLWASARPIGLRSGVKRPLLEAPYYRLFYKIWSIAPCILSIRCMLWPVLILLYMHPADKCPFHFYFLYQALNVIILIFFLLINYSFNE